MLVGACVLGGAGAQADAEIQRDSVEGLIAALSAESYAERELASGKLWMAGQDALSALEDAANTGDPEVVRRSRVLLMRIRACLTPDSPAAIVALVDRYRLSGRQEKIEILTKLNQAEAHLPLLSILSREVDEDVRLAGAQWTESAGRRAMRELMEKGDLHRARGIIDLMGEEPEFVRWMAGLLALEKKLGASIREMEAEQAPAERSLLLACYRRAGEVDKALALAKELERTEVVASLSVLAGDPGPYLDWLVENARENEEVVQALTICRERWYGRDAEALRMAGEMLKAVREDESTSDDYRVFRLLHLNGYFTLTLPVMKERNSGLWFGYCNSTKRFDRTLDRFAYPDDEAGRRRWRDARIEKVTRSWNFKSAEADDLFSLAIRLRSLGARNEAAGILGPLHEASYAAGPERWHEFLKRASLLLGYEFAVGKVDDSWGEEDYLAVIKVFFGVPEEKELLWSALGRSGQGTLKERFNDLALFQGYREAAQEEETAVWRRLLAHGLEEKDEELLALLLKRGEHRQSAVLVRDLMLASCAGERFEDLDREKQWQIVNQHVYLLDWERSMELLRTMDDPAGRSPGLVAGVLLQLGEDQEARDILRRAERQAIVAPGRLVGLAAGLERAGCVEEAARFRWRVAVESDPGNGPWDKIPAWILREAKLQSQWKMGVSACQVAVARQINASSWSGPNQGLRHWFRLSLYRALVMFEEGDDATARTLLEESFLALEGEGEVSNDMFSLLRKLGLIELHDRLFELSYGRLSRVIEKYPRERTVRNSIAWMAACAHRRLDEAELHARTAISLAPHSMYFETLGELRFGQGDRAGALEWSRRGIRTAKYPYADMPEVGGENRIRHQQLLTRELGP